MHFFAALAFRYCHSYLGTVHVQYSIYEYVRILQVDSKVVQFSVFENPRFSISFTAPEPFFYLDRA